MIPAYDRKINRKVRVFISSTFQDMQEERNIIVHSVFPRLRKVFAERMIDITEVDLRWGIPEEDSENSKILEICIGEVLRCTPFFVGIVGNRYGFIAPDDAISDLPPAYKKALGDDLPSGLSITELEMRAGVFVPNNVDFSCFFIKGEDNEDVRQPELMNLISSIKSSYEAHSYQNNDEFENSLFESLHRYISRMIPEQLSIPYNDRSYYSHLKIVKNNNYRYIPDNFMIAKIERIINEQRKVYIRGEKGLGKSACVSWLIYQEGMERNGDVFFHFAAAGNQSFKLDNIFHRLKLYLESVASITSIEEDPYNAVIDILTQKAAVTKRLVLFFDAMDQLSDVTAVYKFFALADINPNVHVVCSGVSNFPKISDELEVKLNKLSSDQIIQILKGSLNQYGKKMSRSMKARIISKENCSNPLYLQAFTSQLRMYGTYSTFEDFFEELINANNFGELFEIVVKRIKVYFKERRFSESLVDLGLAMIVYSNNGVRENELQDIVDFVPVARSVFLTALELFIIDDDGLIKFNHDLIIRTTKYILEATGENYQRTVAEKYITYFSGVSDDWRKYSELPFQLYILGKSEELKVILSDCNCFLYLMKNEYHPIIGYLSSLVEDQMSISLQLAVGFSDQNKIKAAEIMCQAGWYSAVISLLEPLVCNEALPRMQIHLLDIIARCKYKLALDYKDAAKTYVELLDFYKETYPNDKIGYASRAYLLGVTYKSMGKIELSHSILEDCANTCTEYSLHSAISAWIYDVYGSSCYNRGKLKKALEILDKSIYICTYLFGEISSELAWSYCYGWNTLYSVGDKTNAIEMVKNAYDIYDQIYLGRGSKLAWAAANAGTAEMVSANYKLAEEHYRFSIKENDCVLEEELRPHVYSLTSYANLANLYEKTKRHEEAKDTIQFALDQSKNKNGLLHVYTANIMLNQGIIEKDTKIIEEAIDIYNKQASVTPDLFFARVCLARIYALHKEDEKAKDTIRKCYDDYIKTDYETELIWFLILETLEKITGNLSEDMNDELDELYRFDDYEFYITHNNTSNVIIIPEI